VAESLRKLKIWSGWFYVLKVCRGNWSQ